MGSLCYITCSLFSFLSFTTLPHVPFPPHFPLTPPFLSIHPFFLCPCPIPGLIHVDKRLSEIKAQLEQGEEVKGGLLTHMLITKEMNMEEIYANVTEMLLAGVDTVCVYAEVLEDMCREGSRSVWL